MSNITLFVTVGSDFYPNHNWDRFNVNVYEECKIFLIWYEIYYIAIQLIDLLPKGNFRLIIQIHRVYFHNLKSTVCFAWLFAILSIVCIIIHGVCTWAVFCCVCGRQIPVDFTMPWASCQIRKIAGAHAPGMPGTFSPSPQVSDPDMHHDTCVTHVPWCMPGSLTSGFLWNRQWGKTFPAFLAHAQPAILRIW